MLPVLMLQVPKERVERRAVRETREVPDRRVARVQWDRLGHRDPREQ